ncbi:hypothetical protein [Bradyrhizobium sp. CCBAU 53415]|uniref:hypothetical protein n=1 Tax=Bradyrhizobium sp. CCBAU 53415 TaxID=1325119 RepID=UPI0023064140|nr:hypothetical protein [Bradyrhizobium sp. CCBAU 53415]MDA9464749.1 hypothetical protein [Bradyrhizobium sp. CCBAU 53415]
MISLFGSDDQRERWLKANNGALLGTSAMGLILKTPMRAMLSPMAPTAVLPSRALLLSPLATQVQTPLSQGLLEWVTSFGLTGQTLGYIRAGVGVLDLWP